MHEYRWDVKNILAGLLLIGLGIFFLVGALQMSMGTPRRLGPGVYPAILAAVAIIMGIILAVRSLYKSGFAPQIQWRAAGGILGGIAAFYVAFRWFGLIPGTFAGMLVSSYADHDVKVVQAVALAAGTAIGVWLIFVVLLTLPLPPFHWGF